MSYTVLRPALPPLVVDADDHRVEGGWHVFRRDSVVLGRPRSVVALRLPTGGVTRVVADDLAKPPLPEDGDGMTSPYAVPLEQLEARSRVPGNEQGELQDAPRLSPPLLDGPHLHPFGDGATGADGDAD